VLCSVIGTFVVLRAMAFLGDALAHAILPGVAIAYLLGANLLVGALVAAVLVALGIGLFSRRGGVPGQPGDVIRCPAWRLPLRSRPLPSSPFRCCGRRRPT